ncbi:MAG: Xaa-Pro peptidase family protein [archaeon]
MKPAILLYGSSDRNKDMFYSTKYMTSSPFVFLIINDVKYMIVPRSEFADARKNTNVHDVFSFDDFLSHKDYLALEQRNGSLPSRWGYAAEVVRLFLRDRGVKQVVVQPDFPFKIAGILKWYGLGIKVEDSSPFFRQRMVKSEQELAHIRRSVAFAEATLASVVDIIRNAEVNNGVLHHDGIPLTSEFLRQFVKLRLYENDFLIHHPIVSCGFDTSHPHREGSGSIRADQPILIDIFPKSLKSGYFADITRTVVRGRPSSDVKRMYDAVVDAQERVISMVRDGVKVSDLYKAANDVLRSHGFNTNDAKDFGFVHSLGHGIGLDVHESPSISENDGVLVEDNVITIEPGLYYPTIGGIRVEDVVLVKKDGCEVLTSFPKKLEL